MPGRSIVALIISFCLVAGAALAQGRPAGVATALVETRTMSETVTVFGEVVTGRESAVAARVSGVAERVPLRVGDTVAEGDVLAQLDTELLKIEVDQAQAQIEIAEGAVAVAKAVLDRAQKALRRAETLRENSTIPEAQLDERSADYAAAIGGQQEAVARVRAAEAALRQAEYQLKNATIRAPFDAVVLQVTTERGQFISVGTQVATLLDQGAMEVEANVPARFIAALRPDLPVEARTDTGGQMRLELRAILPTEFSATRTRPVRFVIADPGTPVAVGQSVSLEVPVSAPREATVVPKDALVQSQGGWTVFVNAEGKAQPREVEIGAALEGGFEVLAGLSPGDEVVVRGNERLRPGQDIAPSGPAASSGGGQQIANGGSASDTPRRAQD
ncbi:efflux RND transporter periplasmic adaptor subunit [Marimonas sp. MJW-29]|uniref:Efflux RND transporter periplasmic adaptor subunit n=1 Tax=Sulfitobacter sediminis TaxID=3234186 RepID=A0ABV3RP57_9RHOB